VCLFLYFLVVESTCVRSVIESSPETQRQATQHDCLPRLLGAEAKKAKKCSVRKIIFCTGLTRAGQKSIVQARQAQQTKQGRTPFICPPRVPICLSFNSRSYRGCKPTPFHSIYPLHWSYTAPFTLSPAYCPPLPPPFFSC
jgi:hypothetical protein